MVGDEYSFLWGAQQIVTTGETEGLATMKTELEAIGSDRALLVVSNWMKKSWFAESKRVMSARGWIPCLWSDFAGDVRVTVWRSPAAPDVCPQPSFLMDGAIR